VRLYKLQPAIAIFAIASYACQAFLVIQLPRTADSASCQGVAERRTSLTADGDGETAEGRASTLCRHFFSGTCAARFGKKGFLITPCVSRLVSALYPRSTLTACQPKGTRLPAAPLVLFGHASSLVRRLLAFHLALPCSHRSLSWSAES
jgi:hypothetical protein